MIISGGGRCNVTTGIQKPSDVLNNYPRGRKFLYPSMGSFPPGAVYQWFEEQGVPLKTESDLRVFPVSDDGHDVVAAFERFFQKNGVTVWTDAKVSTTKKESDQFILTVNDKPHRFDFLLLATGGQAYRHTGSTGDGYAFAESLGHTVTDLHPSLNSFLIAEDWLKELSGVSHPDGALIVPDQKKTSFRGPFLITHKGLTGPAVFALSALTASRHYNKKSPMPLAIDFFPDLNQEQLSAKVFTHFHSQPKKLVKNLLGQFLPRSLETAICQNHQIDIHKNAANLSKKELQNFLSGLKSLSLTITGRGAGDEFVTAGGIPLSEVDRKNMQSNRCRGLFFAGEILDIDGFTGGFNLQASWATGHLAGRSMPVQ